MANDFGYSILNIRLNTDLAPDGRRLSYVPIEGIERPLHMGLLMAEGAQNVLTVSAFVDHCLETGLPGLKVSR